MRRNLVILFSALILLTACSKAGNSTPTVSAPTATQAQVTPTSEAKPLVILELPTNMDQTEADQYQTLVYNLAQTNDMRFQVRNTLTPADLAFEGPALKVVIALPPDPGLAALTAAAPGVQFLAINIPDLPTAANLSSVGATGVPVDQQAFLAGYIAGMVAPEWRTGILYQKDTPGGDAAHSAFENGYHFYCGDCFNPNFTQPFAHGMYPIPVGIPTDAALGDYNGYANLLIRNFVKVAYVYPAVATPDVLAYMAQDGVELLGESLPSEDVRPEWIASIAPNPVAAVQQIFTDMLAGNGGQVVSTPLQLADVNSSLLSDAKMRLVQQVLDGLQNGTIGTGVTP